MSIHPTAIIDPRAEIAAEVSIGPYVIIEGAVKIGRGTKVYGRAYIAGSTEIGEDCQIHMGTVVGHEPQDLGFRGGESFLKIGDRNIFRENVTIHRGTEEKSITYIGHDNYFMGGAHVAHNCIIGNKVIVCNNALLAGYVEVEDQAFISGGVVIHQFTRIGKLAMISGWSALSKDVPPFLIAQGRNRVKAVNVVGLRRAGFSSSVRKEIRRAFKTLFRSGLNLRQALFVLEKQELCDEVRHLAEFIKNSKRGVCRGNVRVKDSDFGGNEEN
jgi:UDP-N-acetylglucosamine acyltransferase